MINNYTLRINWEYARNIDFLTFRFHETNIINPMQNTSWKEYYGFYTIKKCFKNFYIKKKKQRERGRKIFAKCDLKNFWHNKYLFSRAT